MTRDKCPDCPLAGPCVALRTRHRGYCDWARAGGAWRRRVVELSRTPAAPAAAPIRVDYGTAPTPPGRCCG